MMYYEILDVIEIHFLMIFVHSFFPALQPSYNSVL